MNKKRSSTLKGASFLTVHGITHTQTMSDYSVPGGSYCRRRQRSHLPEAIFLTAASFFESGFWLFRSVCCPVPECIA